MGIKGRFTKGAPAPPGYEAPEPPQEQEPLEEPVQEGDAIAAEIRNLAAKKLRHRMGVRKELANLPSILGEGEQVLNLAAGQYDGKQGLIVVTDQRMIFYEKGLGRSRQEDFPYPKVSSIQTTTKMMSGEVIIFVSGNKAQLKSVLPKERVNEIGDYVRGRISDRAATAQPGAPAATNLGHEDRLRRLRAMLDQSLISADEYEAKRREILEDL